MRRSRLWTAELVKLETGVEWNYICGKPAARCGNTDSESSWETGVEWSWSISLAQAAKRMVKLWERTSRKTTSSSVKIWRQVPGVSNADYESLFLCAPDASVRRFD